MLDSATGDETGRTQEDLEANAFAGLLLMPDQLLHEQILLYGLDKDLVSVDSILMLMDMFAMPYKAVVLRLFESRNIFHQQDESDNHLIDRVVELPEYEFFCHAQIVTELNRCISLVSVFSRLKEESNWTLADAEPYIESLIAFYQDHHQTTFRVMETSEVRRLQRIPCKQVLQEIFDGKFIELKNGMLRYKQ
ncbi:MULTISPECIES: ImmA/IrrE family metallo-endopeptidase [unclassified Candidatus Paralachnospira]|uniref:ImmA/IrrE family metallo-endopeptidase n=1 Tax=unclassified Candidatus Paralachnospira TaxID=3099471 RepID=UPI003F8E8989